MERAAIYGGSSFKACIKCGWTGPLESFEVLPALIKSMEVVRCPNCGENQDITGRVFSEKISMLPDGFTIVSGGQTGVDRGALDASIELGIPHRGWCPKGRRAEDGLIPARYNMQEMKDSQYWKRTEKNVLDSDGTLVFPGNCESRGTALTIRLARKHGRPLAVVQIDDTGADRTVASWISSENIGVMNVAGPRESGSPGICSQTRKFLLRILASMKVGSGI